MVVAGVKGTFALMWHTVLDRDVEVSMSKAARCVVPQRPLGTVGGAVFRRTRYP